MLEHPLIWGCSWSLSQAEQTQDARVTWGRVVEQSGLGPCCAQFEGVVRDDAASTALESDGYGSGTTKQVKYLKRLFADRACDRGKHKWQKFLLMAEVIHR